MDDRDQRDETIERLSAERNAHKTRGDKAEASNVALAKLATDRAERIVELASERNELKSQLAEALDRVAMNESVVGIDSWEEWLSLERQGFENAGHAPHENFAYLAQMTIECAGDRIAYLEAQLAAKPDVASDRTYGPYGWSLSGVFGFAKHSDYYGKPAGLVFVDLATHLRDALAEIASLTAQVNDVTDNAVPAGEHQEVVAECVLAQARVAELERDLSDVRKMFDVTRHGICRALEGVIKPAADIIRERDRLHADVLELEDRIADLLAVGPFDRGGWWTVLAFVWRIVYLRRLIDAQNIRDCEVALKRNAELFRYLHHSEVPALLPAPGFDANGAPVEVPHG